MTDEHRRRVLVAEDDDGAALLHVARDGVQQVEGLPDHPDLDELLMYVGRHLSG